MINKGKAVTFVGFSIRARKCKIGVNACKTLKSAELIILCKTAGEDTKKEAYALKNKFNCELIITNGFTLEEITFKDNAKVMAITDCSLAKGITENLQEDFIKG